MREQKDVVVIGGGQAGLAMSSVLQHRGREHLILERRRIGERWRTERWDSLRFQFPNWTLQLPGYTYRGNDPDRFAHYSEILGVVEDYAVSTGAPVRENTEALALTRPGAGDGFEVSLTEGSIHAQRVVIATGPFQRPLSPSWRVTSHHRCSSSTPRVTGHQRHCLQAPSSLLAAAPQAVRSPTNCYTPGAGCTCR